jgi:hypothetical protein
VGTQSKPTINAATIKLKIHKAQKGESAKRQQTNSSLFTNLNQSLPMNIQAQPINLVQQAKEVFQARQKQQEAF